MLNWCIIGLFAVFWLGIFAFQPDAIANEALDGNECSFDDAPPIKITNIDKYGVLTLDDDRRLKLADLFFPLNKQTGTLSPQTHRHIQQLIEGKEARVLVSGPADRYGREPVFLYLNKANGAPDFVQERLIRSGVAAFMPEPQLRKRFVSNCDFHQIKAELIAMAPKEPTFGERERSGFFPVFSAKSQRLWDLEGEFVVVQGAVTEVRRTNRGISINFGDDWKKDFTAYFSPSVSKSFENNKNLNSNLTGQQIQLRGFLDLYYGPSMRIDHLTQLEMLSE